MVGVIPHNICAIIVAYGITALWRIVSHPHLQPTPPPPPYPPPDGGFCTPPASVRTPPHVGFPVVGKHDALDSMSDDADKDIYKEDIKEYSKDNCELTRSANKLYSLVLGQCTKSLHAKMKGKEDWKKIDDKRNSVELVIIIK